MALSTTVTQEINGLYVALYNRAADGPALDFWVNVLAAHDPAINIGNASTTQISAADAQFLGQQFVATQSTYFTSQYGLLNDLQYVQALYVNIGGNTGDPVGVQYWFSQLQQLEANGVPQTTARADVAGLFVQNLIGIDLTVGATALNLSATQYAAAVARQQQLLNKVAVSQYYADESRLPGGTILDSTSTTSPAFQAAIAAIASVTNDPGTVATAEAAILAAVQQASLTPILNLTFALNTFTLTAGADVITEMSGMGHDVINAPLVIGALGLQVQSLSVGDMINVAGPGNVANIMLGGSLAPFWPNGTTINGVQTINFTNVGNLFSPPSPSFNFLNNVNISGSLITGMTTLTDINSTGNISIINLGTGGLPTLLQTINMTNTGNTFLRVQEASALLTGTQSLNINLDPVGFYGPAATPMDQITYANIGGEGATTDGRLSVGPDIHGNPGFGTFNFNVVGMNALALGTNGSTSLTKVTFTGSGSLILDAHDSNDFSNVTTIDAHTMTGNLILTGASGLNIYGDFASQETGNGNSWSGFLAANNVLTSIVTGSGNDWVNIGSMDLADVITNGLAVDLGAGTNELVVSDDVATSAAALTFFKNVQILGIDNLGDLGSAPNSVSGEAQDTINMKNLPSSVNEIQLIGWGTQLADLIITNGANGLKVDLGDAPQAGGEFGHQDTFITSTTKGSTFTANVNVGEPGGERADMGTLWVANYQTVNLTSSGSDAPGYTSTDSGHNHSNGILVDDTPAPSVTLNISGTENLHIGDYIQDVNDVVYQTTGMWTQGLVPTGTGTTTPGNLLHNSLLLFGNGTFITDTNTGVTTIDGLVAAGSIDAHSSGGLVMFGADLQVQPGLNGAYIGDVITGSLNNFNLLNGSLGNDVISTGHEHDTTWTQGGADTINLLATHEAQAIVLDDSFNGFDHSGLVNYLYTGAYGHSTLSSQHTYETITEDAGPGVTTVAWAGTAFASHTTSSGDLIALQGFWGVNPGGEGIDLTASKSFGTSADMSVVNNFHEGAAGDQLVFMANAWEHTDGTNNGLTDALGAPVTSGEKVSIQTVDSGGVIGLGQTAGKATDVVEILDQQFANASALAKALQNDTYHLYTAAGVPGTAGVSGDFIVVYADTAGNVRVADVNLVYNGTPAAGAPGSGNGGITSGDIGVNSVVHVSDMVELAGATLASFNAHNILFA